MGLEDWTRDGCSQVPVRRENMYAAWERNYVLWEIRRWQDERVEEGSVWVWTPRGSEGTKYSHKCPA